MRTGGHRGAGRLNSDDYLLPLADLPFDFFANINCVWQDDVNYDIKGSPLSVQDGYGVAKLNVGTVENTSERYAGLRVKLSW